jgi:hypothetical protein
MVADDEPSTPKRHHQRCRSYRHDEQALFAGFITHARRQAAQLHGAPATFAIAAIDSLERDDRVLISCEDAHVAAVLCSKTLDPDDGMAVLRFVSALLDFAMRSNAESRRERRIRH